MEPKSKSRNAVKSRDEGHIFCVRFPHPLLSITHFSNTNIEGTITAKEDGLMYTSIPQNGNWEALVDGKPAEILTVGNAMVSVMIPQGEHTVQFVYKNKALTLGAAVAIVSTLALVGAAVVLYNPKLMKKFRKKEQ